MISGSGGTVLYGSGLSNGEVNCQIGSKTNKTYSHCACENSLPFIFRIPHTIMGNVVKLKKKNNRYFKADVDGVKFPSSVNCWLTIENDKSGKENR